MTTKGETAVERFLLTRRLDTDGVENSLSYLKGVWVEPPQRNLRKNFPRVQIEQIDGKLDPRGIGDYTKTKQTALIQIQIYVRTDNNPPWTFWDGSTIASVRAGTDIAEHILALLRNYTPTIATDNNNDVLFLNQGDISRPPAPGIEQLDRVDVYRTNLNTLWSVWL